MGYMVPLNFIEISKKPRVAICATRIVAILSTDMYQARRTIHDEKKAGKLINACGTNAAKSAIIMDNGAVASSPFTVPILMNKIEKANETVKNSSKLKVYDVEDIIKNDEELEDEYDEDDIYDE